MATLQAGTIPTSGLQPAPSHRNLVEDTYMYLTQYLHTMYVPKPTNEAGGGRDGSQNPQRFILSKFYSNKLICKVPEATLEFAQGRNRWLH